ncbi:nucleoside/nucleotide kinase family protein [Leifsonia shinshuensis]|uniref:nucleoside/nucleotide kinase family protein n=1 Tax=Leifsonia shinshuensis TaxID=150026 RepID=UPI001F515030|nr:nucleoside/nucleotide kinase family protein [Leifsonia shinshuensis]MCI0156635.1 nucleoside/nucleotide kinase family protein [Leifsonia shinshuensis]
MDSDPSPADPAALARRALALTPPEGRTIVGIAGSPGSGKTTLARAVVAAANAEAGAEAGAEVAAYLPMDGFHLADATLEALGRRERKGAIDTFDGWGFLALLQRARADRANTVYAPAFDRTVGEPVAGSIAIDPGVRLVVVEGNYLLAPVEPWARIPGLLAESWFVATPEAERLRRLIERHVRHGRTPEAARAWAIEVDGANARLIEPTATTATLIVDGGLPVAAA